VRYEIRTQLKAENLKEMAKQQNGLLYVLERRLEYHKITKLVTNGKNSGFKGLNGQYYGIFHRA
jgi:hypothetical protein